MSRVIAVLSGKGGTGKTTTSVNLASALSELGEDVLLIDVNIQTPNVSVLLGEPDIPITLTEVIKGTDRLKSAVYKTNLGFKLIPASLSFTEFGKELSKLKTAIHQARSLAETIILDCPPGLGNIVRFVLEEADEVLLVTNPELPALADGIKVLKLAEMYDVTVLGVVVNKAENDEYESPPSEVENLLGYPIVAAIPSDKCVKQALKLNQSVMQVSSRSKYSKAMKKLAARVAHKDYVEEKSFFQRLFGR